LSRFVNALPTRFEVGERGSVVFNACQVDVDTTTGRALAIERERRTVEV
jgi:calcineurin-like phosphoesterase